MSHASSRRRFLKSVAAASAVAIPQIIPGRALGKEGAVAPSERITLGGIGVGNRGSFVLSRFLPNADVQMVADADLQRSRRERVKAMVDEHYGNSDQPQLLNHLPVDILKIDGGLINGLSGNKENQARVQAILELANEHSKQTIAECVDDAGSLAQL